jgi:hypothetical protein
MAVGEAEISEHAQILPKCGNELVSPDFRAFL